MLDDLWIMDCFLLTLVIRNFKKPQDSKCQNTEFSQTFRILESRGLLTISDDFVTFVTILLFQNSY